MKAVVGKVTGDCGLDETPAESSIKTLCLVGYSGYGPWQVDAPAFAPSLSENEHLLSVSVAEVLHDTFER